MASRSYIPVAGDAEPESRPHLSPKRSTYSSVEEFELSSRNGSNLHDDDTEPIIPLKKSESSRPRPVRTLRSGSVIVQAIVDSALILPALYFLAFGFIVYSRDRMPLDGNEENSSLVQAAALGPTIFPIAFAAVVARFLKSAAAWRIERQGATVAVLEQLLGSRTVVSAITLPCTLRLFNALTLPLVLLWALSPIGGQSSRRVVSTGPLTSSSPANISYLDTNSAFWMGGLYSGSQNESYWPTFSAAYISSMVAPSSIRDGAQDTFAHFKIPMIEYLDTPSSGRGNASFIPITDYTKVTWSSLLGIPMAIVNRSSNLSLPEAANSTFTVESSYWNVDCSELALRRYEGDGFPSDGFTNFAKPPYEYVRTEKDSHGIHLGLQKHTRNSTGPRVIYWESLGAEGITHTKCELTTTYVESRVTCTGTTCAVNAIRRSSSPFTPPNLSMLDYMVGFMEDWQFFVNWLWATPGTHSSTWSNPNAIYFTNPASPFMLPSALVSDWAPDIATSISTETFNKRFSQLLNTAWLASVAPGGVTGDYEPTAKTQPPWGSGGVVTLPDSGAMYASKYTTASLQREHTVIYCSRPWLGVLVITSVTMLVAGLAGMTLEMGRQGPDMLGAFSSLVRDNRYCRVEGSSSMLDGVELSNELANERVRLGDVSQQSEIGHVAIGKANGETAVQRLRQGRLYG